MDICDHHTCSLMGILGIWMGLCKGSISSRHRPYHYSQRVCLRTGPVTSNLCNHLACCNSL